MADGALRGVVRKGKFPHSCNLPTGLGKTSVIAIWLIALINRPTRCRAGWYTSSTGGRSWIRPRTRSRSFARTAEAGEPAGARSATGDQHPARPVRRQPRMVGRPVSAGGHRGTVDMIGSRLLFSGYGVGFKTKPLHAGFLGQDVLLVHDEAHLEPAFRQLLVEIEKEQQGKERSSEMFGPSFA